jgi:hypothetical protein
LSLGAASAAKRELLMRQKVISENYQRILEEGSRTQTLENVSQWPRSDENSDRLVAYFFEMKYRTDKCSIIKIIGLEGWLPW